MFLADLSEQPDGAQYLSLIAHHLVVDLVSWRIILDDLETVLSGGSLQACLSFQVWNNLQMEKALEPSMKSPEHLISTGGTCNDLALWEFTPSTPILRGDYDFQTLEVDEKITNLILGDANRAFQTEPVDLLLSAIWAAFFPVFLERQGLTIWRDSHGREPWNTEIDLSRTVGWFTTISPIHVTSSTAADLVGLSRIIKDARKRFPANGWAYFTSRYLSHTQSNFCSAHGPPVEVEFNYHGQFQQLDREESLFDRVALDEAVDEGPHIPAPHLFDFQVFIQDRHVNIAVSWNRHIAHQDRIRDWIGGIPVSLKALCCGLASRQPLRTLCDYPFLNLGYARLDELQQYLLPHIEVVNNSKVVEVLPCSPTVTGMLLSQSKQHQLYKISQIFEVMAADGHLPSVTSLAAAWQEVIAHQPSLRSVFPSGLDHHAAFNQVILESFYCEVAHFELDNEEAAMDMFAGLQPLDYQQLKPPHRLTICRVGQHGRRILCQIEMSHAITDATTSNLLIHDWSCAYDGSLSAVDMLATCREVAWTFARPAEDMLGHWQQKLKGTLPCHFPCLSPGNAEAETHGERFDVSLEIPGSLVQALGQLNQRLSVTSASILQAAWALTLASYCGTESVCFGYLASGRDLPIKGLDRCAGAYANMLVCRVNDVQKTSHRDLMKSMHSQMVHDLGFQHCDLAAIQHALKVPSGQSLFNSSFNCQKVDRRSQTFDGGQRLFFQSIEGKDPAKVSWMLRFASHLHINTDPIAVRRLCSCRLRRQLR